MNAKALITRSIDRLPYRWTFPLQRAYYHHRLMHISQSADRDLIVLQHLIRPGDTVIDIGANYGLWTRFLAEATGEQGLVLAIEPVPRTYDLLRHTSGFIEGGTVRTVHAAISDQDGNAIITVPAHEGRVDYYRATLNVRHHRKALHRFKVQTICLDSLIQRFPAFGNPSFVKCDVEGHELAVINGGKQLIEKSHPSLVIELDSHPDETGTDANEVKLYLEFQGYRDYVLDGNAFVPRVAGHLDVNYIFIHESRFANGL